MTAAPRRIFLSHISELREHPRGRSFVAAAESAVARAGDAVADMAYFTARDGKPAEYCQQQVQGCDVYVGIVGFCYGSRVRDRPEVSYTELEFEAATSARLLRLVFLLDEHPDVPLPRSCLSDDQYGKRQEAFRRRLREAGLMVATFCSPEQLELLLLQSLLTRMENLDQISQARDLISPGQPEVTLDDFSAVHPRRAGEMVNDLPLHQAVVLLASAKPDVAARVLPWIAKPRVASILADMHPLRARALLEALPATKAPGLRPILVAADAIASCYEEWRSLGETRSPMYPAAPSPSRAEGYCRDFENGMILWSERGGAQPVWYGIAEYFKGLGGSAGRLGFPLSPELRAEPSPQGTEGVCQRFESSWDYADDVCELLGIRCGAIVYWLAEHGSHATWGGIGEYYERQHGTCGRLGFPVGDEAEVHSQSEVESRTRVTKGWRQQFEGGTVYWSESAGAVPVWGEIGEYFENHQGAKGALGFPVTDEGRAIPSLYGTDGSYQRFEAWYDYPTDVFDQTRDVPPYGATVYWSKHGAHLTWGAIGYVYEQLGGSSSQLGFPVSDEIEGEVSADGRRRCSQRFEGGEVYWRDNYVAVPAVGPVLELMKDQTARAEELGYPVAPQEALPSGPGDCIQFFEHGVITVKDGRPEAWLRPARST